MISSVVNRVIGSHHSTLFRLGQASSQTSEGFGGKDTKFQWVINGSVTVVKSMVKCGCQARAPLLKERTQCCPFSQLWFQKPTTDLPEPARNEAD